jgi:hypothetical protein
LHGREYCTAVNGVDQERARTGERAQNGRNARFARVMRFVTLETL